MIKYEWLWRKKEALFVYEFLLTFMLVLSIFTILVIALQPTRTQSSSNAFMGGAGELFEKQKARGLEAFLIKTTVVCLILFFGVSYVLSRFF